MRSRSQLSFEEVLSHEWASDPEVAEFPLSNRPLWWLAGVAGILVLLIGGRVVFLNIAQPGFYGARALSNLRDINYVSAPRGAIMARDGTTLAADKPVFAALLDVPTFLRSAEDDRKKILDSANKVLGISADEVMNEIRERASGGVSAPVVLSPDLSGDEVIKLKSASLPGVSVVASYGREYPAGAAFSSILGYTNLANAADLAADPFLTSRDEVGRSGVESYYDAALRGTPGTSVKLKDAKGRVLGGGEVSAAKTGAAVRLSVDAGFQNYFYNRLRAGLQSLGRIAGGALAINPQTGEVLALASLPSYDNGMFASPGRSPERQKILTSAGKPLFNRVVSGQYNPGSTIKPLVAVAALKEGVIDPAHEIFSPGYLELPNQYDPEHPLRFLDWRWQGNVNLSTALAYSSNVYFYSVGGGANGIAGLGITRLRQWWDAFGLGKPTGIDLPGEAKGFLPSPDWKEKVFGKPWLLGDTFNVSIGQGDLLVTPLQLLSYIGAIATGGKIIEPHLGESSSSPNVLEDLTALLPETKEVQKGMREAVTDPRGTAHTLNDLPIQVAAKTGSAQVQNNQQENAFFVGYLPAESLAKVGAPLSKQIAILVFIENSKEGSLNAVPIAKDVFNWYYWNRLASSK